METKGQIGFGHPLLTHDHFTTDRLVIVYYPRGAGGKFLINALGLSNQSVLQDSNLAKQQYQGHLSTVDKLSLLIDRYQKKILDAGLGCGRLFGVRGIRYPALKEYYPFNSFLQTIIDNKLYFFIVAHNYNKLKNILEVWPNARLIYFINSAKFLEKFRSGYLVQYSKFEELKKWWNLNRLPDWPEEPPAWQESLNAPPFSNQVKFDNPELLEKLLTLLPNESILEKVDQTENQMVRQLANAVEYAYCWDAMWYEDKTICLQQIERLYKKLELQDYNADNTGTLYSSWRQQL
jgi:hypothetical protein